jgi:hypothetical protein
MSDKRRAELPLYNQAKAVAWERDRGLCQGATRWANVPCGGPIDPHHIDPTGEHPKKRCDPDNIVCLCRAHHDQVHQVDPVGARARGLLR